MASIDGIKCLQCGKLGINCCCYRQCENCGQRTVACNCLNSLVNPYSFKSYPMEPTVIRWEDIENAMNLLGMIDWDAELKKIIEENQ